MSDLSLIKELRDKTGAGFLDCKNALSENNNNIERSIDSLRKKGLAKKLLKLVKEKTGKKIILQKPISPLGSKLMKSIEEWK